MRPQHGKQSELSMMGQAKVAGVRADVSASTDRLRFMCSVGSRSSVGHVKRVRVSGLRPTFGSTPSLFSFEAERRAITRLSQRAVPASGYSAPSPAPPPAFFSESALISPPPRPCPAKPSGSAASEALPLAARRLLLCRPAHPGTKGRRRRVGGWMVGVPIKGCRGRPSVRQKSRAPQPGHLDESRGSCPAQDSPRH